MTAAILPALAALAVGWVVMVPTRAMECDCAAAQFCTNRLDLLDELDARIRDHVALGRTPRQIFLAEAGDSLVRPRIERWADRHAEASLPAPRLSRYRDGFLPLGGPWRVVDASVKVAGVCIGADKLGHFFQQGWECFQIAHQERLGPEVATRYAEWLEGVGTPADYAKWEKYFLRQSSGKAAGFGGFGRRTSGVISRADVEASCAGRRFYHDLSRGRFRSLKDYVSAHWCEEVNRNEYVGPMIQHREPPRAAETQGHRPDADGELPHRPHAAQAGGEQSAA